MTPSLEKQIRIGNQLIKKVMRQNRELSLFDLQGVEEEPRIIAYKYLTSLLFFFAREEVLDEEDLREKWYWCFIKCFKGDNYDFDKLEIVDKILTGSQLLVPRPQCPTGPVADFLDEMEELLIKTPGNNSWAVNTASGVVITLSISYTHPHGDTI